MTEKKSGPKKRWFAIVVVLLVAAVAGTIVYFLDDSRGRAPGPSVDPGNNTAQQETLRHNGREYVLRDDLETVLIMGLDKYEYQTGRPTYGVDTQQADFLLLLLIDNANKTCVPFHINRDTMCTIWQLDIYGDPVVDMNGQIALAHSFGTGGHDSCRNEVRAVSDLLYGMKIDHYISVTMDVVATLNDMVGGVTVTVLDDFSQVDKSLVQGQEVTLKGEQALVYVRGRMSVGDRTNLSRMERQRQYLEALREQFLKKADKDDSFTMRALTTISDSMTSDCSVYKLSDIAEALTNYTFTDFETIAGEAIKGDTFMEYYADEDELYEQVIRLFYIPVEEAAKK